MQRGRRSFKLPHPAGVPDDAGQKSGSGKCMATERRVRSDFLEARFWPINTRDRSAFLRSWRVTAMRGEVF